METIGRTRNVGTPDPPQRTRWEVPANGLLLQLYRSVSQAFYAGILYSSALSCSAAYSPAI